jgi:hypothetical protein
VRKEFDRLIGTCNAQPLGADDGDGHHPAAR